MDQHGAAVLPFPHASVVSIRQSSLLDSHAYWPGSGEASSRRRVSGPLNRNGPTGQSGFNLGRVFHGSRSKGVRHRQRHLRVLCDAGVEHRPDHLSLVESASTAHQPRVQDRPLMFCRSAHPEHLRGPRRRQCRATREPAPQAEPVFSSLGPTPSDVSMHTSLTSAPRCPLRGVHRRLALLPCSNLPTRHR